MNAIEYLRRKEWSMGNGQCPECHGAHAGWYGHPCYLIEESIGHKLDCPLAASLKSLAEEVLYRGAFTASPVQKKKYEARKNSPGNKALQAIAEDFDNFLADQLLGHEK